MQPNQPVAEALPRSGAEREPVPTNLAGLSDSSPRQGHQAAASFPSTDGGRAGGGESGGATKTEPMDTLLADCLSKIVLGEPQRFKNLVIFPVFAPVDHGPEYLTLFEALQRNVMTITEVTQAGQVPHVKVTNLAEVPVLLMEGEELIGARQNRVLNTSILIKEKSELIIPVSCTEAGRWHYNSPFFSHSGHFSSARLRRIKSSSVAASLKHSPGHKSDQSAVWAEVHALANKTMVSSPTSAMHDIFQAKRAELDGALSALQQAPEQSGVVVLVNDRVAGFDLLSSTRAYRVVHDKIVQSYALDALVGETLPTTEGLREKVDAFLGASRACAERAYPVVGCGSDYRYEAPGILGSALVSDGKIIHLNLYRN